jgi:ribonuclease J
MGDIVFIEDVRVDNIAGIPTEEEESQYKRFAGKEALLLTMDSTSVEKPGWSLSENVVVENIDRIIKDTHGRLIIGTFASQVERILAIITACEKYGKKLVIEGRSMKSNVDIIKHLKLIKATDVIVPITDMDSYPPDRLVFLVTGAQGEEFAAMMRMASQSHKYVRLRKGDTILLSSSIIPTNHASVIRLKDKLYRSQARVITYLDSDVHASGHGNREELKWIHEHIKYRFFVPLHGNHYMLKQHAELSMSLGTPAENVIVPDNGSILEISDGGKKISVLPMKAPSDVVTVDGFTISDIQDVVMQDRKLLSESGIFVIVASVNTKTGRLKKSPDIISRGFVYLRESQELLQETRNIVKRAIERNIRGKAQIDFELLKKIVADDISKYLFQQTAKEPLVIPVILGV